MRWKVNRKNVRGRHICYWIKKANLMIIDHGNEGGDIHVYKHLMSTDSKNLKSVLDEYVNGDIASKSHLEITEIIDDNSLFGKIFTYQSKQNDDNLEKENKDWLKSEEEWQHYNATKGDDINDE